MRRVALLLAVVLVGCRGAAPPTTHPGDAPLTAAEREAWEKLRQREKDPKRLGYFIAAYSLKDEEWKWHGLREGLGEGLRRGLPKLGETGQLLYLTDKELLEWETTYAKDPAVGAVVEVNLFGQPDPFVVGWVRVGKADDWSVSSTPTRPDLEPSLKRFLRETQRKPF